MDVPAVPGERPPDKNLHASAGKWPDASLALISFASSRNRSSTSHSQPQFRIQPANGGARQEVTTHVEIAARDLHDGTEHISPTEHMIRI